jgi:hypothetical protein
MSMTSLFFLLAFHQVGGVLAANGGACRACCKWSKRDGVSRASSTQARRSRQGRPRGRDGVVGMSQAESARWAIMSGRAWAVLRVAFER